MNVIQGVRKLLISASAAGLAVSASAVTISVDRVQQRYPWNNLVDIDYTISGLPDDADPMDYYFDVTIRATVNGEPIRIAASNFVNYAWCDLPVTNGTWRATWDSAADGVNFRTDDLGVEFRLCKRIVSASEADYAIIDISRGKDAAEYPIRYVVAPNASTKLFNTALYKTERIVLKKVPSGEFMMGRDDVNGVKPAHTVVLTKDFFAGVFLVTQRQYELVIGSQPANYTTDAPGNPAAQRPVEQVPISTKIFGTSGFVTTLNKKVVDHGNVVSVLSIPTEAQIDYLSRAGVQTKYLWGDTYSVSSATNYCWCAANAKGTTHAVGQLMPNNWGFYDVVGNLRVWCPDHICNYDADPKYDAETNTAIDPVGGATGDFVCRGDFIGSDNTGNGLTLFLRNKSYSRIVDWAGFRLSMELP